MRRNLSRSENLYAGEMRTQAVRMCMVRGGVDPDALDAAFAAVLADHPSLRSCLEQDAEGGFLRLLKPEELPRLVVRPDGPDVLVQEWNTPLPLGGPLVRAVLLTGEHEDTLLLGADHAICDGRSATALCFRLWQYYADIKAGTHPAGPSRRTGRRRSTTAWHPSPRPTWPPTSRRGSTGPRAPPSQPFRTSRPGPAEWRPSRAGPSRADSG